MGIGFLYVVVYRNARNITDKNKMDKRIDEGWKRKKRKRIDIDSAIGHPIKVRDLYVSGRNRVFIWAID